MLQNIPVHMFADSSGVLGLNVQAFVIQILTFLLVFLALRQWAFKPIIKVLDDRRKVIDDGINLGEKMQKEEAELEKHVSDKLHKARREADKIIASAQYEARQSFVAAEESAHNRTDAMVEEAKEHIKEITQRERVILEKELVGLVSEVSEAIIGEKVDAQKDAELIDKAFRERKTA